jgi:hypothetical protein
MAAASLVPDTPRWIVPLAGFPLRLHVADADLVARAERLAADLAAWSKHALKPGERDDARSHDASPEDHAALFSWWAWLRAAVGAPDDAWCTFRLRRTVPGQGHPRHLDGYADRGGRLVATTMLVLEAPAAGGETIFFPPGGPVLALAPRVGALSWWDVCDAEGRADERMEHEGRAVRAGSRLVLLGLVWRAEGGSWRPAPGQAQEGRHDGCGPDVFPVALPGDLPPAESFPGVFCVQDRAPEAVIRVIRVAVEHRGLPFFVLRPGKVDLWHANVLPAGAVLWKVGISEAATVLLERLWHPRVATLETGPLGPLTPMQNQLRAMELAGVPVPPWAPLLPARAADLERLAAALGGFPLVLRLPGTSGGDGVVRVDTLPGLISLADALRGRAGIPEVKRLVNAHRTWRVVVVDGAVVTHSRLVAGADGFRSVYRAEADEALLPEPVAAVAQAAVAALPVLAAGVDLLEEADGRVWVLEANTPFYFGHHQEAGADVAGALLEAMLRRAANVMA